LLNSLPKRAPAPASKIILLRELMIAHLMYKRSVIGIVVILLLLGLQVRATDTTFIKSPSGTVVFKLYTTNGQLLFGINSGETTIIEPSPIVMSLDEEVITNSVKIKKAKTYKINESYPWFGNHTPAINRCTGEIINITNGDFKYTIEIRVFDDGAAFRLNLGDLKARGALVAHVPDESTTFKLPHGSAIWYHDMYMHYEGVHTRKTIDSVLKDEWVAPPATFKIKDGLYASITEADLKNYGGFSLQADGSNGLSIRLPQHQPTSYPYRLRYSAEDTARLMQPAGIFGTIVTPWRVVLVGNLNSLVNADIIHNLCPPPDKKYFPKGINTDWIKPDRAVWKYLDGGGDGTVEVMKKFTDEAAALGFQYNLLEGFWTRWSEEQLRELVNYSKQKNVGIWLWKHSKSLRDRKSRDSFFRHCQDVGVVGAKIDFFDHEGKEVIDLYQALLREAASYHILLDFHGANKPTGQSRTWPNELTREAVKGMEASKLMDRATHETTIPFTRYLAGPAEYTVVMFGERRRNTTWAHQVASAAILSAPMLTYAANPENILSNPAVDVIKEIPATWDETIVLPQSEIGELAAYARRKGNTWFVAVMNGVNEKSFTIPLTFLKRGVTYSSTIIKDQLNNPAAVVVDHEQHTSDDQVVIALGSGGGYVAMFKAH
jgi:alpha-glucosidase